MPCCVKASWWKRCIIEASSSTGADRTHTSFPTLNQQKDHVPVTLKVRIASQPHTPLIRRRVANYDRQAAAHATNTQLQAFEHAITLWSTWTSPRSVAELLSATGSWTVGSFFIELGVVCGAQHRRSVSEWA